MLDAALNLGVYELCRGGETVGVKIGKRGRLSATRAEVSMFSSDAGEPTYFRVSDQVIGTGQTPRPEGR
jgi:hypothetical protein